jgi:hypothetical protein
VPGGDFGIDRVLILLQWPGLYLYAGPI